MHKYTKLTPSTRQELYHRWCKGGGSIRSLATSYHVDKHVVSRVILRGRLGDFTVHDSTNHRFRTLEYGLKRLSKVEAIVQKRLDRHMVHRYERTIPGELLHGDTKRLPPITGLPGRLLRREVLFVAIDDASRFLMADIMPDKTSWSASLFMENTLLRLPFTVECHYSDNGGEYKGGQDHVFRALCTRFGIEQRFTKPYHPWTNGKAERVIRTLLTEWLRPQHFTSYDERRTALYQFVDYYNHQRPHMGINNLTPFQRLTALIDKSGDNA
jgi:transposase InsO family protein